MFKLSCHIYLNANPHSKCDLKLPESYLQTAKCLYEDKTTHHTTCLHGEPLSGKAMFGTLDCSKLSFNFKNERDDLMTSCSLIEEGKLVFIFS